jgi:orotate phosphoribosyltransferase
VNASAAVATQSVAITDVKSVDSLVAEVYLGKRDDLVAALAESEALLRGHFRLLSGRHSDTFFRFRNFASWTGQATWMRQLSEQIRQSGVRFDIIVAPETAGSIIASSLAERGGTGSTESVLLLRVDSDGEPTTEFLADRPRAADQVLIVNDVLTTGHGVSTMRSAVDETGAEIVGLALFATRIESLETTGYAPTPRLFPAVRLAVTDYDPSECPLCRSGSLDDILESRDLN